MAGQRSPYDDDDDDDRPKGKPKVPTLFEFDCPSCDANNPWPDGFKSRDEVMCHYCGKTYEVAFNDEGRLKLKEL